MIELENIYSNGMTTEKSDRELVRELVEKVNDLAEEIKNIKEVSNG